MNGGKLPTAAQDTVRVTLMHRIACQTTLSNQENLKN